MSWGNRESSEYEYYSEPRNIRGRKSGKYEPKIYRGRYHHDNCEEHAQRNTSNKARDA